MNNLYENYRTLEELIHETAELIRSMKASADDWEKIKTSLKAMLGEDIEVIGNLLEQMNGEEIDKDVTDEDNDIPSIGDMIEQDCPCDESLVNIPTAYTPELLEKYADVKLRKGGKPCKLNIEMVLQLCCYIASFLQSCGGKCELNNMITFVESYDITIYGGILNRGNILDFLSGHSYSKVTKDFFHRNGKMIYIN